ncbi:MAG: hypothetical protein HQL67_08840 [Magnetococcales bacterium]|nr:hypothetical protein [Magnetococcales bacterium]
MAIASLYSNKKSFVLFGLSFCLTILISLSSWAENGSPWDYSETDAEVSSQPRPVNPPTPTYNPWTGNHNIQESVSPEARFSYGDEPTRSSVPSLAELYPESVGEKPAPRPWGAVPQQFNGPDPVKPETAKTKISRWPVQKSGPKTSAHSSEESWMKGREPPKWRGMEHPSYKDYGDPSFYRYDPLINDLGMGYDSGDWPGTAPTWADPLSRRHGY